MLSERQRKLRKKNLGGSDMAAVVELFTGKPPGSLSPYKSAADVFWDKRRDLVLPDGEEPKEKPTSAQKRGNTIESWIIECARAEMDPEQLVANQRRVSRGRDGGLIACNLDAYAKGAGEPVEAKSCADYRIRDEWGAAGSDEVPFGYMIQVQTEILVCGPKCQRGHLFAVLGWRSDMMPVWYILKRHDGLIRLIEDAAMWFWKEHVEPGVPPKGGEIPPEALLRAIRPDAGKTAELGDDMLAVANALETHKELRLLHEKGEKACELELRNALRDASVGLLPDGRRAEIKTVKRKGYTVEETEYTQFAIKTPKASKGEE